LPARTALTIDAVNISSTQITGVGNSGDTLQISLNGTVISSGTTITVDSTSKWSFVLPAGTVLSTGDIITATVISPTGVDPTLGTATKKVVNNITGAQLTIDKTIAGDTALSGSGNSGDKLQISINGNIISSNTKIGTNGNWSLNPLPNGYVLAPNDKIDVTVVGSAPSDTLSNATYTLPARTALTIDAVNISSTQITGVGNSGDTIQISLNGTVISSGTKITVDSTSKWSFVLPAGIVLNKGDVITATVISPVGVDPILGTATKNVVNNVTGAQLTIDKPIAGGTTLSGKGNSGDKLQISINGQIISSNVKVNSNGNWSLDPLPNGYVLASNDKIDVTVVGSLPGDTLSNASAIIPSRAALSIDAVSIVSTQITGTGMPGDQLQISLNGTVISSGTTIVIDTKGKWSFDLPVGTVLNKGDTITATVISPAGVDPTLGTATKNVVNNITGNPLTLDPVTEGSTTISGSGNSGDKLQISVDNIVINVGINVKVGNNGKWTFTLPSGVSLKAGSKVVVSVIGSTNPIDTASAIVAPRIGLGINPVSEGDTKVTGVGNNGDVLTVTLTKADGTVIILSPPGGITVANSIWRINPLPNGYVLASGDKIVVSIVGSTNPNDTKTAIVASKLTVGKIMEGDKSVSGKGTPGHTIQVKFPDGSIVTAVVGPDGTWTVKYKGTTPLAPNQEVIAADLTDSNVIPVIKPVMALIEINKIYVGDTKITGTAQPGGTIVVTLPDGTKLPPVIVDANGNWSVDVPPGITLTENEKINAEVINLDGTTNTANGTVGSSVARVQLYMYMIFAGDKTIAGTGNKGDVIQITINGVVIGTTVVDNKGDWVFDLPAGYALTENSNVVASVLGRSDAFDMATGSIAGELTPIHIIDKVKNVKTTDTTATDDTTKANKKDKTTTTAADTNTDVVANNKLNAVIYLSDYTINVGDTINLMQGVTALDNGGDGKDLTNKITVSGSVNTNVAGTYILTYTVTGANGTTVSRKLNITVVETNTIVKGYTYPADTSTYTGGAQKCNP